MSNLKDLALKYLKVDSPLRQLILSEPESLPRNEVAVKVRMFSKLLEWELSPKEYPEGLRK